MAYQKKIHPKQKATTLCVVDVQDYFSAARKRLGQVLKEIELAKRRNAGIVVLEFSGCGKSSPEVLQVLAKYPHVRYVKKRDNCGADELIKTAQKHQYNLKKVRFCGVNRSYCVHETVEGFVGSDEFEEVKGKVEIAIDATWCSSPSSGRIGLKRFGKFVRTHV